MRSIRRLYFYLLAFISIEMMLWGLIGLLRSVIDETIAGAVEALARPLAFILVSVPIFLFHWLAAQRAAAREPEERTATLRAVFFYAILLATCIPVLQNLLSFLDRAMIQSVGLGTGRALLPFRQQTLADNLIAMAMNGLVAAYFWSLLRTEWTTLPDRQNFTDVRRLYRYIWMLYGLLMTVFGAQQLLRFLFYVPGDLLGRWGREVMINGIALLLVGTPVWIYAWQVIQNSLVDPAEKGSALRLGVLYLLALGGVITVVTTAAMLVNVIVARLLGAAWTAADFFQQIGGPISVGVTLGMVWAYYGYWLNRHIESMGDPVRQAGMKRLYTYLLALIGLVVAFVGAASLLSFIINMLTRSVIFVNDPTRRSLASSIASLVVGLPLWLTTWRPAQSEALARNEKGDHARRSVLRKAYLYLVLFGSVVGGMSAAVALLYQLIRLLLTGQAAGNFFNTLLNTLQLLVLFVIVLIYHLNVLRRDGASTADALAEKQSSYSVLIVDSGDGFVAALQAALLKLGSKVQVAVTPPEARPAGVFQALLMSGSLGVDPPEWIRSFDGSRIVVRNETKDIVWADDAAQGAQSVLQLAEGQEVRRPKMARSPWMIVVYVFAGLFGLLLLMFLLSLGIALVTGRPM